MQLIEGRPVTKGGRGVNQPLRKSEDDPSRNCCFMLVAYVFFNN